MTDIKGEVVEVTPGDEVVPGEKLSVEVMVDNLRNTSPPLGGSCKASWYSTGEPVKFYLDIIDEHQNTIAQDSSPEICVPYAIVGKGQKYHKFEEIKFANLGRKTISIDLEGLSDRVDVVDGVESFTIDVVEEHDGPPGDDNGDNGNGDNGNGGQIDLIKVAIENPIGTAVVLGAAGVAFNEATDFGGD